MLSYLLVAEVASIRWIAEKSSSRQPAVLKVATYRILTQMGEYSAPWTGTGAGRIGD